jgi:hypothetical protein
MVGRLYRPAGECGFAEKACVSSTTEARARAILRRKVAAKLPKTLDPSEQSIDEFIREAQLAISTYVQLRPMGKALPQSLIDLLRKINRTTERWHRQLSRSPIRLPEIEALRRASDRKARLYARPRGRAVDSRRHGLIDDLRLAYAAACPNNHRGFQPVANVMLTNAMLPVITKHELANFQKQIAKFEQLAVALTPEK